MSKQASPHMTLCPQCKSIQKAGTICSICKFPIPVKGSTKHVAQYGYGAPWEEEESETTQKTKKPRLSNRHRIDINEQMMKVGLDGNGRFENPTKGLEAAISVMAKNGIELDVVPSSWALMHYDQFRLTLDLAWTNDQDSFSPIPINNTMLLFTWYKLAEDVYECLAYLS